LEHQQIQFRFSVGGPKKNFFFANTRPNTSMRMSASTTNQGEITVLSQRTMLPLGAVACGPKAGSTGDKPTTTQGAPPAGGGAGGTGGGDTSTPPTGTPTSPGTAPG